MDSARHGGDARRADRDFRTRGGPPQQARRGIGPQPIQEESDTGVCAGNICGVTSST